MRTSTIFFFLGLLFVANATNQHQQVFAQIEASSFGESMLDLVQINMQAHAQSGMKDEDLFDQILELVEGIEKQYQDDRVSATNVHNNFQADANAKISVINTTLNQQRETLQVTQDQLAADRAKLAETQSDLASAQAHLAEVTQAIQNADDENTLAVAAHEKKVNELGQAIQACKDAVVEIAKLGSSQFVQVNMVKVRGGMQKVENVLKLHLPARLSIFKPIITALVSMGTNADPALVEKVSGLINQLESSLQSELSDENNEEANRVDVYNHLRADLVNDQSNTNSRISSDVALINTLNDNISQNQAIVDQLNVVIPQNALLLQQNIDSRDQEQANFEADDAQRAADLEVLAKLNSYLQDKAAQVSSYLRSRVGFVQKRQI